MQTSSSVELCTEHRVGRSGPWFRYHVSFHRGRARGSEPVTTFAALANRQREFGTTRNSIIEKNSCLWLQGAAGVGRVVAAFQWKMMELSAPSVMCQFV